MTLPPSIRVPLTGMDAYLSIFGANGRNLSLLEGELGVTLAVRGSDLEIGGGQEDAALAAQADTVTRIFCGLPLELKG